MERERPFFYQRGKEKAHPRAGGTQRRPRGSIGFARLFATLIAAGHDPDRLGHYTYRQLMLYYREALVMNNEARADRVQDVATAFGGGKAANKLIKTLRGGR